MREYDIGQLSTEEKLVATKEKLVAIRPTCVCDHCE